MKSQALCITISVVFCFFLKSYMLQLVISQISHQNVRAIISTLLHVYQIEKQVKVTHFCVSVYHAVVLYQDSLNCGSQPWPGSEENGLYLPLTYPHMEREK